MARKLEQTPTPNMTKEHNDRHDIGLPGYLLIPYLANPSDAMHGIGSYTLQRHNHQHKIGTYSTEVYIICKT